MGKKTNTQDKFQGFTIVELLIVVVVIAILAAITIVAYNGISERTKVSSSKSAVSQASKKVMAHYAEKSAYPADLAAVSLVSSGTTTYNYKNYGNHFCVAAITGGVSYQSIDGEAPVYGNCNDIAVEVWPSSSASGLEYSGDSSFKGLRAAPLNYSYGGGSALDGAPTDNYVAVYTGFLTPPVTGAYTLRTVADDRGLLYIDDKLVIDGSLTGSGTAVEASINLEAGKPVRFQLVLREIGGNSYINLNWATPSQSMGVIPAQYFNAAP